MMNNKEKTMNDEQWTMNGTPSPTFPHRGGGRGWGGLRNAEWGIKTPNSELPACPAPVSTEGGAGRRTLNSRGVTLIEVVLIIVIIGILAAVITPEINFSCTSSRASVDGAAYIIASDIRYAQECAMANRVSKSIMFTIGQNSYTFPATVPPTSSLDPSGQLPEGVTISNNSTDPYIVQFNSLGEPIVGGDGWVEVTVGGQTRRITVLDYTGKVNIS
jgi:type II secretory pathway pseudopilin PulG